MKHSSSLKRKRKPNDFYDGIICKYESTYVNFSLIYYVTYESYIFFYF